MQDKHFCMTLTQSGFVKFVPLTFCKPSSLRSCNENLTNNHLEIESAVLELQTFSTAAEVSARSVLVATQTGRSPPLLTAGATLAHMHTEKQEADTSAPSGLWIPIKQVH